MNLDDARSTTGSRLPRTADVVVVGGGVIGTSIALHLARAGAGGVVLLESQTIGSGASGRSSGMVRQHYSHPVLAAWARQAVDAFHQFGERYGGDPGFVPAPYVMVCGPEDAPSLEGNVALQREAGVVVELLSVGDLRTLMPNMRLDDIAAASYEPDAGYADALRTTTALAGAARRAGVCICERSHVLQLRSDQAGVRGVVTTDGSVGTGHVVLAAGSGAAALAASTGIVLPIEDLQHEVVAFAVDQQPSRRPLMVSDRITGLVSRPDGARQRRTGATDVNEGSAPGRAATPAADVVRSHADRLAHRFPTLGDLRCSRHFAGMYHMTPDAQPILGSVQGVAGLTLAVGFCHGFKLAPVLGELLARCVLDGADAVPDLAPFALERFAAGELITPAFGYSKAYAG